MKIDNIKKNRAAFRPFRRMASLVLALLMLCSGFAGDEMVVYAAEEKGVTWLDAKTYFGPERWSDDLVSCKITDGATKVKYFNYSGTIKPESEELLKNYLGALEADPYNLKLTYQDEGVYCYHVPDSGLQPLQNSKTGDHLLYISLERTSASIKIEVRVQAQVKWDKLSSEEVERSAAVDTLDIATPTQAPTEPPTQPPTEKVESTISIPAPDHYMGVDFETEKVNNAGLFTLPNRFRFGFKEYPKTYMDGYLELLTGKYQMKIWHQNTTSEKASYMLSYNRDYVMRIDWDSKTSVLTVSYKDSCQPKDLETWAEENAVTNSGSGTNKSTGGKSTNSGTASKSATASGSGGINNIFKKRENNFKCTKCGGDGERGCSRCGGDGGSYEYKGSTANFSGKKNGSKKVRTWVKCSKCRGSGSMKCTSCGGDGVR